MTNHWISDTAPDTEPSRKSRVLTSMRSVASWPNCSAEDVAEAAIQADNEWLRIKIMDHSRVDNWLISQRDALIKALFEVE